MGRGCDTNGVVLVRLFTARTLWASDYRGTRIARTINATMVVILSNGIWSVSSPSWVQNELAAGFIIYLPTCEGVFAATRCSSRVEREAATDHGPQPRPLAFLTSSPATKRNEAMCGGGRALEFRAPCGRLRVLLGGAVGGCGRLMSEGWVR
jgi:hypothetical protein